MVGVTRFVEQWSANIVCLTITGALAKDAATGNVYNGVVLKWTEPLDAKVRRVQ